jgi:hypothetical protein
MDAVREFRSRRDDVVPRMYILTDGQLTDPRQCYDRTGELAGLNIEVNSYGFGGDFAFQSMKQLMGQCPGGMVKQIRDTNDILETFRRIVQVTALIAASQVKLELQYTDGVIPGDFFCHRPAPRIWRVHDFQPARAPQFDIGNIELQRRYIWAFEARLPENAHTGLAVGILNIHFRRTGRFHCASWPILPPITADSKVGDKNEDVGRVFTALEDLRDNSPEILIAAYEAKIQIAQEEGRDPDYIRAMQDVLDKLRKGLRRKDIDQALLRAAEVDPASFFPPPPRQMSGPDQG